MSCAELTSDLIGRLAAPGPPVGPASRAELNAAPLPCWVAADTCVDGFTFYQKSKALSKRYSYEVVYSRIVDHDAAVINNTILLLFYIIKSINDGLAYNI